MSFIQKFLGVQKLHYDKPNIQWKKTFQWIKQIAEIQFLFGTKNITEQNRDRNFKGKSKRDLKKEKFLQVKAKMKIKTCKFD